MSYFYGDGDLVRCQMSELGNPYAVEIYTGHGRWIPADGYGLDWETKMFPIDETEAQQHIADIDKMMPASVQESLKRASGTDWKQYP